MTPRTQLFALTGTLGLATFALALVQAPHAGAPPTIAAQEPSPAAPDMGSLTDAHQRLHDVASRVLWDGADRLGLTVDKGALIASSLGAGRLLIGAPVAATDLDQAPPEATGSRPRGSDVGPPGGKRTGDAPQAEARDLGVDGRVVGVLVTTLGVVRAQPGTASGAPAGGGALQAEVTEAFQIVLRTSGSLELLDAAGETVLVVEGAVATPGVIAGGSAGTPPGDPAPAAPLPVAAWGEVYGSLLSSMAKSRS